MMTRWTIALGLGLALYGCKDKGSTAKAPPGIACEDAATAYVGRHELELNVGHQLHVMAETAIELCKKRAWSEPVKACLRDARSGAGAEACFTERAELVQLMDALHIRRTQLADVPPPVMPSPSTPSAPAPTPPAPAAPSPGTPSPSTPSAPTTR